MVGNIYNIYVHSYGLQTSNFVIFFLQTWPINHYYNFERYLLEVSAYYSTSLYDKL